jgi:hypothetical protein
MVSVRTSLLSIVLALSAAGCVSSTERRDGLRVYDGIRAAADRSFALAPGSDAKSRRLLELAVARWNGALENGRALRIAKEDAPGEGRRIVVSIDPVDRVEPSPGHTELAGCLGGLPGALATCRIVVGRPRTLAALEDWTLVAHLFRTGPLDPLMHANFQYRDAEAFLIDKLTLMTLIHEIGHTIGLGHADDGSCMMAATPRGDLGFCAAEVAAAKELLAR